MGLVVDVARGALTWKSATGLTTGAALRLVMLLSISLFAAPALGQSEQPGARGALPGESPVLPTAAVDKPRPLAEPPATDRPGKPNYGRAALENLTVLILGVGYYYYDRDVNSIDWEFDYSWSTLEAKLAGKGYGLDTNFFNTNYISHPGAGALYYATARANHLSALESLGFAFGSSTVWEFLAEFRERVSVNDVFVTPLGGFALGETAYQLGEFFATSCDTPLNRTLSGAFGALARLHGPTSLAAAKDACDALGFRRDADHSFKLAVGGAVWRPMRPLGQPLVSSVELDVTADVATPPKRRRQGIQGLGPGAPVALEVHTSTTPEGLRGASVAFRALAVGLRYQDAASRRPPPNDVLFGLGAGVEWNQYRYDLRVSRYDPLFILAAPMLEFRWRRQTAYGEFEFRFHGGPALAGAGAFALSSPDNEVPSGAPELITDRGYNHALGLTASPQARWKSKRVEVSLNASADALFGLEPTPPSAPASLVNAEFRRRAQARLSLGRDTGARGFLALAMSVRHGELGSLSHTYSQTAAMTGIEWRY